MKHGMSKSSSKSGYPAAKTGRKNSPSPKKSGGTRRQRIPTPATRRGSSHG